MSAQPEPSWAWLGLLKWSLTHVDGTVPSEESPNFKQMSKEDRKFLEEVMKNGIINEGERMTFILKHLVAFLDTLKASNETITTTTPTTTPTATTTTTADAQHKLAQEDKFDIPSGEGVTETALSTEEIEKLLQELQDIVEQIDFAKSFMAMGGTAFLLGCASQTKSVPQSIRAQCLAVLGTLNQNNPAVQQKMLEEGNIPKLIDLFFAEYLQTNSCTIIQARALQAMSCSIRNHHMAEQIFCMNQEGRKMIEAALGLYSHDLKERLEPAKQPLPKPSDTMRKKALFFLQALITSDSADSDRISLFANAIQYAATRFVDSSNEDNSDIRETTLSMLTRILDQKKNVNVVLDAKEYLIDLGIKCITKLRRFDGEEKQMVEEELRLWELLISQLAKAARDEVTSSQKG
eukprot:scaffold107_cov269-Chaetoceros_neogracile.AAC.54